mmetsp:Transcript_21196/g.68646  ORF Transcript_21196/g.68646 Transcript_21196/m.68646 type:complete len:233 (-) Transcript_21196:2409-3107(-)
MGRGGWQKHGGDIGAHGCAARGRHAPAPPRADSTSPPARLRRARGACGAQAACQARLLRVRRGGARRRKVSQSRAALGVFDSDAVALALRAQAPLREAPLRGRAGRAQRPARRARAPAKSRLARGDDEAQGFARAEKEARRKDQEDGDGRKGGRGGGGWVACRAQARGGAGARRRRQLRAKHRLERSIGGGVRRRGNGNRRLGGAEPPPRASQGGLARGAHGGGASTDGLRL